jgi:hypothetical protein
MQSNCVVTEMNRETRAQNHDGGFLDTLRPELVRRLVWEARAVEEKFPGRFRLTVDQRGEAAWEGQVPVEGRDFPVRVHYPRAYPALPPSLLTPLALPAGCPHVLERSGGYATLCWIAPGARRQRSKWNPQRHTAATALRAAQRWGLAFLVWSRLGTWPVPDAFDVRDRP